MRYVTRLALRLSPDRLIVAEARGPEILDMFWFGGIDTSRLRQCERQECDLLFFDPTRSRSQRWHAENPCGWLERQHRRRARA
jgi:CGNR zinc finger